MDLIELGAALGDFFERDGKHGHAGPSHDQLTFAIRRTGLEAHDPRNLEPMVGKTRRLRRILTEATDHNPAAGFNLAKHVIAELRAAGAFDPRLSDYAGDAKVAKLRNALDALGYDLSPSGTVHAKVIDNLHGSELTAALQAIVRRMNVNADDAELHIGSGKELDEAAARHVLEERTGSYPVGGPAGNFPVTLANAFTVLGLAVPTTLPPLDSDPHREVQQCLYLLAVAVNRLRNDAGTGHGHPSGPRKTAPLTPEEGRVVARATALIAGTLLDKL
ncbi:abortive infection family protein [Blastococcus sp. TF02A-26]|uniref:abortive infection family protein n=1 Tax=Blastococcus sp. TF02A-26 TaxID=2250577 RepID=UPI000DE94FD3|nr:abortive infection family protein [Blastococcus sp. TF02A-26]RBY87443.1 hypothetical protein DQ240_07610 [Blastococcus sp. TF02A-26]